MLIQVGKTLIALGLVSLVTAGCTDATILKYEDVIVPLDGQSELHISTYPSNFPSVTFHIPFIFKRIRTPDSVYLQFFVRSVDNKSGSNPHVETIKVHSFTYEFPGQTPVQLVSDYDDSFWMQGSQKYNPNGSDPVPHSAGWYIVLKADITLNGKRYLVDETSHAASSRNIQPLIFEALR